MNTLQDNIITILGIQTLPIKERDDIVRNATDLLQWRIISSVLTRLDEPSQLEFHALIKNDASEKIVNTFITKHVSDLDKVVDEQIKMYKKELAVMAQDIDQVIGKNIR